MASKETEQLLEEELQALHQSIEQLNAGNSEVNFRHVNQQNESHKPSKRKRANQADVQTQTPKKSRKRQVTIPEELVDDLENPIDEVLEGIALRKNLTTNNVKHLLRNIIANESVQEMLKCSLNSNLKMSFEPKFTRSKTKEWLETQKITLPLSAKKTSDTLILMEEDFPEDSSGDEYRPNEDDTDIHSDEESFLSSHTSDIGSPASSAPPTPNLLHAHETFKRPFPIEQHQVLDDLIGSRTRSKLPLNDTPLEHLELAFIPPDISTDMYDSDCDNEEWRKFLKEFVCPPSHHSVENIDDEEADPEYNVLEEEEEVDDEELRADRTVQITKKEVSELLSELFEEDFSSSDEEASNVKTAVREEQPCKDILQTAMSDIIVELEPTSPNASKSISKPTGIVQPLVLSNELSQEMAFTISFPTLDCPPVEIFPQHCPSVTLFHDPLSEPTTAVLSPEAKLLLSEQMRKHVQLLTQMHLITAQQTALASVTEECRVMLHELVPLTQRVEIANLTEALELVTCWDIVAPKIPPEQLRRFQASVVQCGDKKKYLKRSTKHPDRYPFDPEMVELMAESRVFIYPELLPKLAIFQAEPGPCKGSYHEDQIMAMGIEQFTPFCEELLKGSKGSPESLVCSMISHYMLPHLSAKKIGLRIKRMQSRKSPPNPVKYYMENKVAPPVHHTIQPFDHFSMQKLCDTQPSLLPNRWRELMLNHIGAKHRNKISPFAMRPLVPRNPSFTYNPTGITTALESTVPISLPTRKKRKSSEYPQNKSKKKELVISTPQHVENDRIVSASQPTIETVQNSLSPDSNPSITLPSDSMVCADHINLDQVTNVPPKKKARTIGKRKCAPKKTHSDSAITDIEFVQNVSEETAKEDLHEETSGMGEQFVVEVLKSPEQLQRLANFEESVESPASERMEDFSCSDDSTSSSGISNAASKSANNSQLKVVETDSESDPQLPLIASSPRSEEQVEVPLSCNQGAKRYVLIQRPDSKTAHVMHVWGPKTGNQANIQVRKAADSDSHNSSRGESKPSQGNQRSTSLRAGGSNCYPSGENASATGASNGGDDDGDKPPSSPTIGHSVDETVVAEVDEEDEDNISLDLLTTVPSSTHPAPTKGKSPAHRQIRHQRNARRILDSWMADDDPTLLNSDAYAQYYFMKVRQRLEQQNPDALKDFVTTLGHFRSVSCSTLELYKKIECILRNHPDLMEEFVLFLSPEAAAQCGVQFQHFLYVRMREFFLKLKIHFKDSPSQLKRTLKILQQVESSPSPNINDIKNAILPLLKGNAHLTQAFLQLFLNDAPPPSDAGDFEEINMDQINSGDEFEYVHLREAAGATSKESEVKVGKRTGSKGSVKNKNKGKSWKKSA